MNSVVPQLVSPLIAAGQDASALTAGVLAGSVDPWSVVSDELVGAQEAAMQECASYTEQVRFEELPRHPDMGKFFSSTAATWTQHARRFFGFYNDTRSLPDTERYTRYSPLGSLVSATRRAIDRNSMRDGQTPAPMLEIGAGERYVPWGLKQKFGDRISIHESSPRYASLEGVIDVEHQPGMAHDALLPPDHFELAYSIFGNIYSSDQIAVLQNVVDAMRVGGEVFLMWKIGISSVLNSGRANRWPAAFRHGGLDISIQQEGFGGILDMPEHLYIIWARKRLGSVDVGGLFARAKELDERYRKETPEGRAAMDASRGKAVRLSTDGPYFPSRLVAPYLPSIVRGMLKATCDALGKHPVEVRHKLLAHTLPVLRIGDADRAIASMQRIIMNDNSFAEQLDGNVPLSMIVMRFVHKVLGVFNMETTVVIENMKKIYYAGMMRR